MRKSTWDFQKYIKSLTKIGVLLTVCSKNDYENAIEPFEKHPEMVLNKSDIVSFKANWEPKSDNINLRYFEQCRTFNEIYKVDVLLYFIEWQNTY